MRDWLDSRHQRMRNVVDDRAAVFARRARIASGRDVESDREIGVLDRGPVLGAPPVEEFQGADNRHAQRGDELGAGVDMCRPLGWVKPMLVVDD